MKKKMVVITGPTATGKTRLAALLANEVNGEIISADSRQIYRHMDIGTGKDLDDYIVNGNKIKAHLIDIADAGERYSLFRYKNDFQNAFEDITGRDKLPIVCGGSGMYIETALGLYNLPEVNEEPVFREQIQSKSDDELIELLKSYGKIHNTTDIKDRERLIRALEIATAKNRKDDLNILEDASNKYDYEPCTDLIYAVELPRQVIRDRITERLNKRLKEGLIDEVRSLIDTGVDFETLNYYGLEYRFISLYLRGDLKIDEMTLKLNTAIHQFAKRQMTWFRRMEKRGIRIKWLAPDPDSFIHEIITALKAANYIPEKLV